VSISECRLFCFRNLRDQQIKFSDKNNLIIGRNGQGKTNLIEAISLLSQARSFRTHRNHELIRFGSNEASVFGKVERTHGTEEIGIILEKDSRRAFVDQAEIKPITRFLGRLPSVNFTPDDLEIVKGGPQLRRSMIDRHLVDCHQPLLEHLIAYQRALKHKNATLRSAEANPQLISPWNRLMAVNATALVTARRDFLAKLEVAAQEHHLAFAPQDGELRLEWIETATEVDSEPSAEAIFDRLEAAGDRELRLRSAVLGPHRDDLRITIGNIDARHYASQGQARSIVLALKLGLIDLIEKAREESPLILLDDVDSELDNFRSDLLFERIFSGTRQTFITGTELTRPRASTKFERVELLVEDGLVSPN